MYTELEPGELIHNEVFSLFEAMAAFEIMDPKMDAGLSCNRKKVLGFAELVEKGLLKVDDFSNAELIGIVDETFACLVTWLKGQSFKQTVWTNLFLHDPLLIKDKYLRTFSYAILEVCELIFRFIGRADVAEEEDFAPMFDIPVMTVTHTSLQEMFKQTEDDLQQRLAMQAKTGSNQNLEQQSGVQALTEIHALLCRLLWTKELHNFFITISQQVLENSRLQRIDLSESQQHQRQQPQPSKFNFISFCEQLNKSLDVLQDMTDKCFSTISFGIKVADSTASSGAESRAKQISLNGDYPTIIGFSPLVNHKLLPPTFPRDVIILKRDDSFEYLHSLFKRLRYVLQVYDQTSLVAVYNFISDYSLQSWNEPCILTRSVLQTLFFPTVYLCFGTIPMCQMLREDAMRYVKPLPLLPKSPLMTNESKELIDLFFRNCQATFSELIVLSGYNRSRQRKKLVILLEDFANTIDEAINLDAYFGTVAKKLGFEVGTHLYFTTWVMYYILRIAITYVLTGFSLELYAPHEYPYIYCYLSEFLFNWLHENLDRAGDIGRDNERINAKMILELKPTKNKSKGKSKRRDNHNHMSNHQPKPHMQELLLVEGTRFLCDALHKSVCGLDLDQRLRRPSLLLNNELSRYDQRFEPLRRTQFPIAVDYSQYEAKMKLVRAACPTSQHFYRLAQKSFKIAKDDFEAITESNQIVSKELFFF